MPPDQYPYIFSRQMEAIVYLIKLVQSRWLDIGLVLVFFFVDRVEVEVNKSEKITRLIFSHLDRTSLVNKGFIIWLKREHFLAGPTREIPLG